MKIIATLVFTCLAACAVAQKQVIVAADGTGDFITVQTAFDAVPLIMRSRSSSTLRTDLQREASPGFRKALKVYICHLLYYTI